MSSFWVITAVVISWSFPVVCRKDDVISYRFLVVSVAGNSHWYSMAAIAGALADRGHAVTVVIGRGTELDRPEQLLIESMKPTITLERFDDGSQSQSSSTSFMENVTETMMKHRLSMADMMPKLTEMFVFILFSFLRRSQALHSSSWQKK